MSVSSAFEEARADGRAALMGYLPAGFPDVRGGIDGLLAMVDAGCDVIEVGLPYSDPVMDGPTIQAAAQQALDGGVRTSDVLRTVEAVAATGTPTVVMTYWNPIVRYGVERFAADLASAGGSGLITPDLTPDSGPDWIAAADERGLDKIFLVAPSSTDERIAMTAAACRGFVYATAVMGVTGARATTSDLAGPLVARTQAAVHELGLTLPVCVGVGVSNGDQAAEVAARDGIGADGVIVGSAFVRALLDHPDDRSAGLRALTALTEDLAGEYVVRKALAALLASSVLLVGACSSSEANDDGYRAGQTHQPYQVPATPLTDTDGTPYSLVDDTDKPLTLVFFGYSSCPDICQVVMANIATAMTRLDDADRDDVDVVFVTTDPKVDTEQHLRDYLDRFDPSFIGLTGSLATIAAVGKPLAVYVADGARLPSGGRDLNSHSTQVTAITADDTSPLLWTQDTSSADLAADIHTLLAGD